ncbi:hypothetical protein P4O66_015399 [Electrophorus voltai]|uniref:Uncharacterized protein n=1 Tax=Electrophorus voltai TaxID=2609070 RepID=A0AAD9DPP9_9TELE|nr:hypothetical protein P4O66_015399 [Electrophorus voltai]
MHIKTGTWEATNTVCESDPLCDPAVLVSPPKPEPHIRNRRLSPGSSGCGGGGGCASEVDKLPPRQTPSGNPDVDVQAPIADRERRAQYRGRGPRREGASPAARGGEKLLRSALAHVQKDRWVGETLTSLRPPPAFPVKDSPAKLQPAVSYASKVKAGGASGGVAEEPPGIRVLLQNQWGLSFISDGPPTESTALVVPQDVPEGSPTATLHPVTGEVSAEEPATSESLAVSLSSQCPKEPERFAELLLTTHHLVEPVQYHTQGALDKIQTFK